MTLIGLANPTGERLTQTYQVRSLRGQSEVCQGSGPDPSEWLELHPRPPSSSSVADAPWKRQRGPESKKKIRSKGFRLRSSQSRQYRNLGGQLRLARKQGFKVDRGLKYQIEQFGEWRLRAFQKESNSVEVSFKEYNSVEVGLKTSNPTSFSGKGQSIIEFKGQPNLSQNRKRRPKPVPWPGSAFQDQLHLDTRCTVMP